MAASPSLRRSLDFAASPVAAPSATARRFSSTPRRRLDASFAAIPNDNRGGEATLEKRSSLLSKGLPRIVLMDVLKSRGLAEVRAGIFKVAERRSRRRATKGISMARKSPFDERLDRGKAVVRVQKLSQENIQKFMGQQSKSPITRSAGQTNVSAVLAQDKAVVKVKKLDQGELNKLLPSPPKARLTRSAKRKSQHRQWRSRSQTRSRRVDSELAAELVLRVQQEGQEETRAKFSPVREAGLKMRDSSCIKKVVAPVSPLRPLPRIVLRRVCKEVTAKRAATVQISREERARAEAKSRLE